VECILLIFLNKNSLRSLYFFKRKVNSPLVLNKMLLEEALLVPKLM